MIRQNRLTKKEETTKEESKSEPKQGETEESYTRVKFDDVPNSGKVNLKKYLSEKVRQGVDETWKDIAKIDTAGLQKMEQGLVNDFNRQFDDISKSQRASKLYGIMKVKAELQKRGSGSKNEEAELSENIELNPAKASEFVEGIKKLYPGYVSSVKSDIPGNWDFSVKNKAATSSGNNYMGVFSVDYKNKKILYESSQFGDDKYTETYDVAQDLSKKLNFKLTDERGKSLKKSRADRLF